VNTTAQAVVAEFAGTAALLAAVVGSGIMGTTLSPDNDGIALLANATATAAMLFVLITTLARSSGAHFNPVVSLAAWLRGELPVGRLLAYLPAQAAGAVLGVVLAHAMFAQALLQPGLHERTGSAQWLSEGVATFGLVGTILVAGRRAPAQVPALVAAYIFAAYWFTASTSFANPAVTVARALTQSFAGIRPEDVAGFVVAQVAGALAAVALARLLANRPESA